MDDLRRLQVGHEGVAVCDALQLDLGLACRRGGDVGDVGAVAVDELRNTVENAGLVTADHQQRKLGRLGSGHGRAILPLSRLEYQTRRSATTGIRLVVRFW